MHAHVPDRSGSRRRSGSEAPCTLARLLAALLFARLIRATRHMRRMRNIPQCATFKLHTLHALHLAEKWPIAMARPGQAINRIDVKSFKCHWPSASFRTLLLPLPLPPSSSCESLFCLPGFLPAVTFIYGPLDLLYKLPVELLR